MSRKITHSNYSNYEEDSVSSFFGLLLFVIAVLALVMVIINFSTQQTISEISELKPSVETTSQSVLVNQSTRINAKPTGTTTVNTDWQSLSVQGIHEVGNTLEFTIEHFSPEAKYSIDFGDGRFRTVEQQTTLRTYKQPGTYAIKVQVEYQGEIKTISTKTLNIFDAIEMQAKVAEVEF